MIKHKHSILKRQILRKLCLIALLPAITVSAQEYSYSGMSNNFKYTGEWMYQTESYAYTTNATAGVAFAASSDKFYFIGQNSTPSTTVTVRYLKSDGTTGSFNITTKDAVCTDYGICNDEAGNIIILATTSFGKGPDRAYVLPKGATSGSACKAWKITDTDVTANQNRAWGLRAYGNTYSYNGYVSMCARQSAVGYRINLKGSDNT